MVPDDRYRFLQEQDYPMNETVPITFEHDTSSVPEISQILRRTTGIILLLVALGLLVATALTSRALYKWEMETMNMVLVAAHSPAKLAVEAIDKRRGQSVTDGILMAKGIYSVTLIDDYGDVLGHSERAPPEIPFLLRMAHIFWPETNVQLKRKIVLYGDHQAELIIDVVLGTSDSGLVEANLLVLIFQAVLIAGVTALTVYLSTALPMINGLRALSAWVGTASLNKIPPLPEARAFKVLELYKNGAFIQKMLTNLFQQKQKISSTVRDLEVQIGLNEKHIRIINQILASTQQIGIHIDASGQSTIYNRDALILPVFAEISPTAFLSGSTALIEQLRKLKQVRSVTSSDNLKQQVQSRQNLLMDIDVALETGEIIQITGFELSKKEHALMISDQTHARAFAQENLQRQKLESLGVLTSGVAHDLNNILAIISGSLELELAKCTNAESRSNLRAAENALHHGSSVVKSLLRFSHKNTETVKAQNTTQIVEDLLLLIKGKIGGSVKIEAVMNEPDACVQVDRSGLANALLNLVINARDAMDGKGEIKITTRAATPNDDLPAGNEAKDFVVFEVSDTGPGVPENIRAHIFDPFFTTKGRDKGTGLGLSLVYNIAETFGGKLSCKNLPDAGAAFMIALPRSKQAQVLNDHRKAARKTQRASVSGNILLVEDEAQLSELSARYLTTLGHTVVIAASFKEFTEFLNSGAPFDLIITDLHLGDGTGFEVAKHAHQFPNPPPIILVSGNLNYGAFDESTQLFSGFLEKPYILSELQHLAASLLRKEPAPKADA